MNASAADEKGKTPGLARAHPYAPPPDTGLQIVYQDEHLIAIDKHAGLLSVPGRGIELQDCALHRLQIRFPQALLVHRLDEATSGLLLFALSPAAQKALGKAFEAQQIHKKYTAWVHGLDVPERGVIDAPISVDWPQRPLRKLDNATGKNATTHYQLLLKNEQTHQTLLGLEPQTGRTHQLRVHLRHISHPIVGDRLYGVQGDNAPRLMLHASCLELVHPIQKDQWLKIESIAPF